MPVLDLTTGPVILNYDTQQSIKERATNKYNTATGSVNKVAPLIESYMAKNGITADTLQLEDDGFLSLKSRIAKALVNEDISGLESDEEINIYNEVRDRTKFDTFKEVAGGRVSGDTVKFFGAEVEELFDKFETKVGSSDVSTTQSADEADYTEAQFDVAMENNQIPPGTYKVLFANGVVQEIQVEDDDVNLDQPRDTTNVVTTQGVMTQEEFDALPPDVGNPPGTMLSPSGATRDARDEWFEKYGDTHNRSGKKKTYSQYIADMTPSKRSRR